jgi:arginase
MIGVPFHSGGRRGGVAGGVASLRRAGLLEALRQAGHAVDDHEDVALPDPDPRRDRSTRVVAPLGLSAMVRTVAERVRAAVVGGNFPLVIGGDCPILLGALLGTGAEGLVHVDGHEDAYRPVESPTGDGADSEIAFALGLAGFSWDPGLADAQPLVTAERLAIVGARDLPDLERNGVASLRGRCLVLDDREVHADPVWASRLATDRLGDGGFWLHLDWDVLSNDEMGSVIFPLAGGLTWDDLATVIEATLAHPGCRGWSVSTYDPDLDPDGADAARIVAFVTRAMDALDGTRTHGGSAADG